MEANIVIAGVPRLADSQDNARRVDATFGAFRKRYPEAITKEAMVEPLGKSSQTVTFGVQAPDLRSAQAMLMYFEEQLMKNGFAPTHKSSIALAGARNMLRRIIGTNADAPAATGLPQARKKPWWRFW